MKPPKKPAAWIIEPVCDTVTETASSTPSGVDGQPWLLPRLRAALLDSLASYSTAERIAAEGDASDATVATLRMQLDRDVGEIGWVRVDASGPARDAAEAWSATYA